MQSKFQTISCQISFRLSHITTYRNLPVRVRFLIAIIISVFAVSSVGPLVSQAAGQVKSWNDSAGGFFETESSWSPFGVPDSGDTIQFFINPNPYSIGLLGDHEVAALEAIDGTDVRLGIGGTASDRTLNILGNAAVNASTLSLQGAPDDALFNFNVLGQLDVTGLSMLNVMKGTILNSDYVRIVPTDEGNGELLAINVTGQGTQWNATNIVSDFESGDTRPVLQISDGASVSVSNQLSLDIFDIKMMGEDDQGNPSSLNTGNFFSTGAVGDFRFFDGATIESESVSFRADLIMEGTDLSGRPTSWTINDKLILSDVAIIDVRDGARLVTGEVSSVGSDAVAFVNVCSDNPEQISQWIVNGDMFVAGTLGSTVGDAYFSFLPGSEIEVTGTMLIRENGVVRMFSSLTADVIENTEGGSFTFLGGVLNTNWFIGDLDNHGGILAPGANVSGETTILGNYNHEKESTLAIDIGGTIPVVKHDLLQVAGFAFLDGNLDISLIDGFIPSSSDEITIAATSFVAGRFANAASGDRVSTVNGMGSFVVNYGFGSPFDNDNIVLSDFQMDGFILGDINGDGEVNLLDVQPFVDALTEGLFVPAADINKDGEVNLLDVQPFVELLTS